MNVCARPARTNSLLDDHLDVGERHSQRANVDGDLLQPTTDSFATEKRSILCAGGQMDSQTGVAFPACR